MIERREPPRYVDFWTGELMKSDIADKIPHFKTLRHSKDAPPSHLQPLFRDVILGGKKVDVYHYGEGREQVYLHIKD